MPSTIGKGLMALDHSGLGLENKFLGNKPGRIFWVRQVYFTKSSQQIWGGGEGGVNQPFILFIHHIWGETALFIIQTSYKMQYFINFFKTNCTQSIYIQNDLSCAFSETVQKISKITYTAINSSKARIAWDFNFKPSYASSKVKNENDAIRNRISDFDKRRISQPKTHKQTSHR